MLGHDWSPEEWELEEPMSVRAFIASMCDQYPNDQKLGAAIREFVRERDSSDR